MKLNKAQFLTSANAVGGFPPDVGAEIAFAGRSNAGKSSAINTLCQQKQLARISKTPGRTQLINFFALSEELRLVDLPGYGYAKTDRQKKRHWGKLIEDYFQVRESLLGTLIIMDIRHPLRDSDQQMIDWCLHCDCPVHILLSKADKLSRSQANSTLFQVQKRLSAYSADQISLQLFSSLKRQGIDQAEARIQAFFAGQ